MDDFSMNTGGARCCEDAAPMAMVQRHVDALYSLSYQ